MLKIAPHILDHVLAIGGGAAGGVGAAAVTADLPGGALDGAHIVGYIVTLLIGLAPIVLRRLTSAGAAGDRVREKQLRAKAEAKRADGKAGLALPGATPATLDAANKLLDDADALEAKADEFAASAAEKEAAGK